MTALLLSALVTTVAASVALVLAVADRTSPQSSVPVQASAGLLASNENIAAEAKIAV